MMLGALGFVLGALLAIPSVSAEPAVVLRDALLRTSGGQPLSFVDDAIGAHPVVIGFAFASCRTLCPVSVVAQAAASQIATDPAVKQLTITLDPANDRPEDLAVLADGLPKGREWLWLSGDLMPVLTVLTGLGAEPTNVEDHPVMFVVGSGYTGRFERIRDLVAPEVLIERALDLHAR